MGVGAAITAVVQLILWILGYVMKRAEISMDAKKSYYKFVAAMADHQLVSVAVKEDAEYQIAELKKLSANKDLLDPDPKSPGN